MSKKDWKPKTWRNFYLEFRADVEGILGEPLDTFYRDRSDEIYAGTGMKFNKLGQTEIQIILECFAKLRGQRYQRYYKASYKKNFKQLMETVIIEEEKKDAL